MSGATRSYCPKCGVTFISVAAFDYHRVGPYTLRGRRCLTLNEMRAEGMIQEKQGAWAFDPTRPRPSPAGLIARYSLPKAGEKQNQQEKSNYRTQEKCKGDKYHG